MFGSEMLELENVELPSFNSHFEPGYNRDNIFFDVAL